MLMARAFHPAPLMGWACLPTAFGFPRDSGPELLRPWEKKRDGMPWLPIPPQWPASEVEALTPALRRERLDRTTKFRQIKGSPSPLLSGWGKPGLSLESRKPDTEIRVNYRVSPTTQTFGT